MTSSLPSERDSRAARDAAFTELRAPAHLAASLTDKARTTHDPEVLEPLDVECAHQLFVGISHGVHLLSGLMILTLRGQRVHATLGFHMLPESTTQTNHRKFLCPTSVLLFVSSFSISYCTTPIIRGMKYVSICGHEQKYRPSGLFGRL